MPIKKDKLNAALSGFLVALVLFAAYIQFTGGSRATSIVLGVIFLAISVAIAATKPGTKTT